jgi:hypothetical protein
VLRRDVLMDLCCTTGVSSVGGAVSHSMLASRSSAADEVNAPNEPTNRSGLPQTLALRQLADMVVCRTR